MLKYNSNVPVAFLRVLKMPICGASLSYFIAYLGLSARSILYRCYIDKCYFLLFSLISRVVVCIFDQKQLLRVSCTLWCYYSKCYSIILENASLWCFIVILLFGTLKCIWKEMIINFSSAQKIVFHRIWYKYYL